MARRIHKSLHYERNHVYQNLWSLKVISDVIYNLEHRFGPLWKQGVEDGDYKDKFWTYSQGIHFTGLDKFEFSEIKSLLPGLTHLTKDTSEYGHKLSGKFGDGWLDGKEGWAVHVSFNWDLPDTCEIKHEVTVKPANDKYFWVDKKTGQIMEKTFKTVVECEKPILDAVFSSG